MGFQYIQRGLLVLLVEETPEICAKIQIIFEYMQAYWFNFVTPKGFLYTNKQDVPQKKWNVRCGKSHKIL
jgi:hypothetical protein